MNGPEDWLTTGGMIAATLCGIAASGMAIKRLCCAAQRDKAIEGAATAALTVLCGIVFLYRAVAVHGSWAPVQSHVDGLSLLAALLGAVLSYLHYTDRLRGLNLFAMPVVTLLVLWGVCASWWTLRPFAIESVWRTVHLLSIYLSALAVAAASALGGLFLYVDRQLRRRDHRAERLKLLGRLGDLESVEQAIVASATVAFAALTIALVSAVVDISSGYATLEGAWWQSPKVLLAAAMWIVYALVMHVRFVPILRGRPAAALCVIGLVMMIAAMGVSLPAGAAAATAPNSSAAPPAMIEGGG